MKISSQCFVAGLCLSAFCGHAPAANAAAASAAATNVVLPGARVLASRDLGVIYFLADEKTSDAELLADLARIQSEGYDHINFASWVWTLPKGGTEFRRRVELILTWCDAHDFGFWLLHNVQYGGAAEYGDIEEAVKNPADYVRPVVADWIETLRGHKCVRGVQLGNEVGVPVPTDASKTPLYLAAFRDFLRARFSNIGALNAAWRTNFASFDEVALPQPKDAGHIDLRRFAVLQFGHFYGAVFRELFVPALGANLGYTTKTGPNPYLFHAFPDATVLGWDDLLANYPLWALRVLADTDARPTFNDEIHLYNDGYLYGSSVELTRYRYFTDALSGQWKNSSYAWRQWNKPEVEAVHAQTPRALADLQRLELLLRRFDFATQKARIGVLVTEPLYAQSSANVGARPLLKEGEAASVPDAKADAKDFVPLEKAYAALAATGRDWRYVLDLDVAAQAKNLDVLVVPSQRQLPRETLRTLVWLPRRVKIEWDGALPREDEYGNLLPFSQWNALRQRVTQRDGLEEVARVLADKKLAAFYHQRAQVPYLWYSPERGHYNFGVEYPRLEARRIFDEKGRAVVALINHTRGEIALPESVLFPWQSARQKVLDITKNPPQLATRVLAPLEVRMLRYE